MKVPIVNDQKSNTKAPEKGEMDHQHIQTC